MAWQTPKTSWKAGDIPLASDFNRIEGNVGELDTKKANQADLASHTDASAPHSGHATTSALSGHTGATTAHAATSAATASRIMMRDAYGRAKVAAPSAADDIARLDTVTVHTGRKDNPHTVTAIQVGGSNILTELKKVDGAGSGLDADLWQGVEFAMPGDTVLITDSTFRQAREDVPLYIPCFVTRPGKYRVTGTIRIAGSGSNACVEIVKYCVVKSDGTLSTRTISNVFKTSSTTNVSFTLNTNIPTGLNEILVIKLYSETVDTARWAYMEGFQVKYAPSTGDNLYHAVL